VINPGEKPWIDVTLDWFDRLGIAYERRGYDWYRTMGNSTLAPFTYRVPGDFSSAAFPIAAALVTGSEITVHNLDMNEAQGDKRVISILEQMGARFTIGKNTLTVKKGELRGMKIDVNDCIDALPILSVLGCFAEGKTEIVGGAIARRKESDRIACMASELRKMGAQIEERPDGLVIARSDLCGADLTSHHDHRVLFSLVVAGLGSKGHTTVRETECGAKTIPHFYEDLLSVGANIELDSIRL
jgi:3-phosphoshikimate 1-carboxyvinyltransferase